VLRLYVRISGVASEAVGVIGAVQEGSFEVEGAGFGIAATEDEDQVLPAQRLRHEFPSLAGPGIAGEGSFHPQRRVEFGFHGFHQVFGGMLRPAQARLFFFDFADLAVDLLARGFRKGIEEFLKAFGLAEFSGERGVDGHGEENLTTDGRDGKDFHGSSVNPLMGRYPLNRLWLLFLNERELYPLRVLLLILNWNLVRERRHEVKFLRYGRY
jgi:hypothetical protein